MSVLCVLEIVVLASGIPFFTKANVEGRVKASSEIRYVVDFSEGIKKLKNADKDRDYSQVLIEKQYCVKM
jgi:hypothetical protein